MRKIVEPQMQLGEIPMSEIQIDLNSRDEIPKLLLGLQHIYCTVQLRKEVFSVLERIVPATISKTIGRRGMDLWRIFVLGAIRLCCNWDYDKLQEIANNHKTLRQMLGHGKLEEDYRYALQTIKDNVSLIKPEHLDEINQIVVRAGHKELGKKGKEELHGQCDSFVSETDVHYPTDINLLFDAIVKVITIISKECLKVGILGWGKSVSNILKIKRELRYIQKLKRSTSKDEEKKAKREKLIADAHLSYIDTVEFFLKRASETMVTLLNDSPSSIAKLFEIEKFMLHARRQIDQIERRVFKGEKIPHTEKVFLIFEEHTEWICKGKAGVQQELGLRVCVLKDQHGFVLYHKVMEKETDDKVAILMVKESQSRFSSLSSCSFDKGFHSPENQKELSTILPQVFLPKKGKLSLKEKEIEGSEEFVQARKKHPAVESSINGLEHSGLDRCLDHGIDGFKRYVALSILARNMQTLGNIVQQKQRKKLKRQQKQKQAA